MVLVECGAAEAKSSRAALPDWKKSSLRNKCCQGRDSRVRRSAT